VPVWWSARLAQHGALYDLSGSDRRGGAGAHRLGLSARAQSYTLEDKSASSEPERWFELDVLPLKRRERGALLVYEDVSRGQRAEREAQRLRNDLSHERSIVNLLCFQGCQDLSTSNRHDGRSGALLSASFTSSLMATQYASMEFRARTEGCFSADQADAECIPLTASRLGTSCLAHTSESARNFRSTKSAHPRR
jgi:hypothetical protein